MKSSPGKTILHEMICKKVGAGIAVIKRVKSFVSKDTLQVLYKAIVQPYFLLLLSFME